MTYIRILHATIIMQLRVRTRGVLVHPTCDGNLNYPIAILGQFWQKGNKSYKTLGRRCAYVHVQPTVQGQMRLSCCLGPLHRSTRVLGDLSRSIDVYIIFTSRVTSVRKVYTKLRSDRPRNICLARQSVG
jgi:hypothetical protein